MHYVQSRVKKNLLVQFFLCRVYLILIYQNNVTLTMIPSRLELIIHHDSITRAISTHFRLDKLPTSHEGPILTQRNCSLRKSLGRLHGWHHKVLGHSSSVIDAQRTDKLSSSPSRSLRGKRLDAGQHRHTRSQYVCISCRQILISGKDACVLDSGTGSVAWRLGPQDAKGLTTSCCEKAG